MTLSKILDKKIKFDETLKQIELMSNSFVLVGFQEGTVTKNQNKDGRSKKGGLNMAQIAAANEFGTDLIPARPFLRPAIDENQDAINKALSSEYDKIILGTSTVKKSLTLVGLFAVDLIQKKILSIHAPPNAPSTIKAKKSTKPLIDFGQMIRSVTQKVVIP